MISVWDIITGLTGVLIGLLSFYLKRLYDKMDTLERELTLHRVEDAAKFLPRSEMEAFANRIRDDITTIVQPLATKMQSVEEFLRKGTH